MNLPKCRCRSRSSGSRPEWSISQQEYSNDDNDSELYLPGSEGVYINKTEDEKPAFGRKKDKLLRDWGFDSFGQVLGLSSYKGAGSGTGRQVRRRMSFSSQSHSSILTTPSNSSQVFTPHGRPSQRSSYSCKRGASPALIGKRSLRSSSSVSTTVSKDSRKSSLRSNSVSTPVRPCHCGDSQLSSSHHGGTSKARDASFVSSNIYPPTPETLPSLRSPPSICNTDNSLPATSNVTIVPIAGSQEFAVQPPSLGAPLNWLPLQTPGATGHYYMESPVFPGPQPALIPFYFRDNQSTTQPPEIRSLRCPIYGPPITYLPSPPDQPRHKGGVEASNSPLRFSPNEAKKCEEHYNAASKANTQGTDNNKGRLEDKKEKENKNQGDIGKHIQHIHFCAGCGRVRSKEYQKAHPLERGQIPERQYCSRCLHDAAPIKSHEIDKAPITPATNGDAASIAGTNVSRTPSSNMKKSKTCRTCRWLNLKKPRRLSLLSSILSTSTASEYHARPTPSVSSTSTSESNISALITGMSIRRDGVEYPISFIGEASHKIDDNASPSRSNVSRRPQRVHSRENKGSVLNSDVHAASSISTTNPSREKPKRAARVLEQNGSFSDLYNTTPLKVPTPREYSTSQRASSEFPDEVRPKVSVQSVSDYSEESNDLSCENRDDTHKGLGEDQDYSNTINAACGMPGAFYSNAFRRNAKFKDASCRDRSWIDAHKLVHENKPKVRIYEQQETLTHSVAGSEQSIGDSKLGWRGHSSRRRVRQHQGHVEKYHDEIRDSYMDRDTDTEPDTPEDPNYTFKWHLPPTPTDIPYASREFDPYFMGESWRIGEEEMYQMEREAEELAEQNLASAGKLFDNMTTPFATFSPSKFSVPSFVTRTEFSINTYVSKEGLDPNIPTATMFELVESSDSSEAVDQEVRSIKTLEFSSEDDLDHKATARACSPTGLMGDASRDPRGDQSDSSRKTSKKNVYGSRIRESGGSSNPLSPNAESSMVVHTGHSMENLRQGPIDYTNSTVPSRRRRIRRPSCLEICTRSLS
ncbi:hypothetical protein M434DRAFT_373420 [Hypoxylon sp. CO27-5]|nr:hypothetical protein M434DRAFT_373420 [Hypoxylon sp. CO27-5]